MKTKTLFFLIVSFLAVPFLAVASARAEKWVAGTTVPAGAMVAIGLPPGTVVDDFNDGVEPNLWGGAIETFADGSGSSSVSYSSASPLGGTGKLLQIFYNVTVPGSFSGCVFPLGPGGGARDISQFKFLSFYVRTPVPMLKIELVNNSADNARRKSILYLADYLPSDPSSSLVQVNIPLDAFSNLDSLANVKQINFVFEHSYISLDGNPSHLFGSMYIDQIAFGNTQLPVRVDSFGDLLGRNALGGIMGSMAGNNGASHTHEYFSVDAKSYPGAVKSSYSVTGDFAGMYFIFGGGLYGDTAVNHDFSSYSNLTFWARYENQINVPDTITIELVDDTGSHQYLLPSHLIHSFFWNYITIPLSSFPDLNKSAIKQMNIVYEDWRQDPAHKIGTVYYDDIQFE